MKSHSCKDSLVFPPTLFFYIQITVWSSRPISCKHHWIWQWVSVDSNCFTMLERRFVSVNLRIFHSCRCCINLLSFSLFIAYSEASSNLHLINEVLLFLTDRRRFEVWGVVLLFHGLLFFPFSIVWSYLFKQENQIRFLIWYPIYCAEQLQSH